MVESMTQKKPLFMQLANPNDYIPTTIGYINPNGIYSPENGNPTHDPESGAEIYNQHVHYLINQANDDYTTLDEVIKIAKNEHNEQSKQIKKHFLALSKSKNNDSKYLTTVLDINEDPILSDSIKNILLSMEAKNLSNEIVTKIG